MMDSTDKRALPQGDRATTPDAPEFGWLIERKHLALWLKVGRRMQEWTADSNAALRFARKCDAEAFMRFSGLNDGYATEHRWG